ncbi:hypothetical protein [Porphyromonas somerae]|uniref:hypothetical protein n=1 Tax=Porphyromonas somerae TaxID=322095 RepID=UPI002A830EDD|nr:hypothetical protein [Porphyromonas somerae]MDY3885434.1 hypothetical protein [Porphyromonas somerae]
MKRITNQLGWKSQRNIFAKAALYTLVGCMALMSCNGKDRPVPPEPTPPPTPSPTPSEMVMLNLTLINGGVIANGKLVNEWKTNDEVLVWGLKKGDTKPITLSAKFRASGQWTAKAISADEWGLSERAVIAYSPSNSAYDASKTSFRPPMEGNKVIGAFRLSHHYNDLLIGEVKNPQKQISTTLASPYKQVQLILQNSTFSKKINGIEVEIEGMLANAALKEEWKGEPTTLKINYQDKKEGWKGEEADTLFFAIPTATNNVTATIHYRDEKGESKEEQKEQKEVSLAQGAVTKLLFRFHEEEIVNPPLAYTIPIDTKYWSEANQKAWNLLHANYGGELDEKKAREYYGWTNYRPLTDEAMHTKTLYKDDVNLLAWVAEMKEEQVMNGRDWGLMLGLETLDGTLVEVYPPLYFDTIGGYVPSMNGGRIGYYDNYCYITAPAGEYRMVCFVKYHKDYVGTYKGANEKWYKLPYLDSRDYDETMFLGGVGKKYLNERIPWEKSPYNGTERVTIIDRASKYSVAPRWRMGMTYQSRKDFENNNPSYSTGKDGHPVRNIGVGTILEATLVNNSNNTLRGTIVAKCEYLPMFNPIGYWRFDIHKERHKNVGGLTPFWTPWSHEVGRVELTISPNSEKKAQVEVVSYNWRWSDNGACGAEMLGPDKYIHLYWVDENGNEEMMNRVDYIYMNNAQKDNFGDPSTNRNYNFSNGWYRDINWREFKIGYGPCDSRIAPSYSNGFNFF